MAYSDGNFAIAAQDGGENIILAFEGDPTARLLESHWIVDAGSFATTALNTKHPTNGNYYLVAETDVQDIGGGLVKWKKTYARVPAKRSEYESFVYTFPGYATKVGSTIQTPFGLLTTLLPTMTDPGRIPQARTVQSRLEFEYFLVGTNGTIQSASAIPVVRAQRYVYGSAFGLLTGRDIPDRILLHDATLCTPDVTTYQGWVTAGTEIVAEDSVIRRWRGNIYERVTRYVVAQ